MNWYRNLLKLTAEIDGADDHFKVVFPVGFFSERDGMNPSTWKGIQMCRMLLLDETTKRGDSIDNWLPVFHDWQQIVKLGG